MCADVAARPRPVRRCRATSAVRHAPRRQRWPPRLLVATLSMVSNACSRSEPNSSSSAANCSASGPSCCRSSATRSSSTSQIVGVGLEAGDDARVHQLTAIALHRTTALDEHRGDAACTLAQLLDAHHLVGEIEVAAGGQLGLGGHHGRRRAQRVGRAAPARSVCSVIFSPASAASRVRCDAISRPRRKICSALSSATRSPWRRAASAWRSSGRSWRRTSRSRSWTRSRLASVASSRRSAFSLRRRNFRTPGGLLDDRAAAPRAGR